MAAVIHDDGSHHPMEDVMKLSIETLTVESFATATIPPVPTENVATCLNTNCGKILCCA